MGDIKVENIIGGMRTLKTMLWEASVLDPNEVSFESYSQIIYVFSDSGPRI